MRAHVLLILGLVFAASCSDAQPCGGMGGSGGEAPAQDAGPDADPVCDQHPELALIESMPCAVDADCPAITNCVSIVCGPAGACIFGMSPPNGTLCERGGICDDRRCCH